MSDSKEAAHLALEARRLAGKVYDDQRCGRASPCEVSLAVSLNEMADLVTDLVDECAPAPSESPATVTDEMVERALHSWYRITSVACGTWPGPEKAMELALIAAVGPALARLEELEAMEQRAKDMLEGYRGLDSGDCPEDIRREGICACNEILGVVGPSDA